MRIVLGVAVVIAGLAGANAACARPADDRPVLSLTRTTQLAAKLSPDLSLRADLRTTTDRSDPFGDPQGPARHRLASSMLDYYPLGGGSGLRFSAGLRFFEVQYLYADALRATNGLLWEPRIMGRMTGVNTGFERHTPAATVGYARTIGKAVFGVEAGSLLGTANARVPKFFSAVSDTRRGGLNPVANINLAFKF